MFTKQEVVAARYYIIDKIKTSNYPQGHPFLDPRFHNDIVLCCLILTKLYIKETTLLDDYLEKKFRSIKNGKFDEEAYFQNLNEFMVFYYLLNAISKTDLIKELRHIHYEPIGQADNNKQLEYSFVFTSNPRYDFNINFEVKTLTCDPFLRADAANIELNKKYIKRFFNDVDLTQIFTTEKLGDYVELKDSTHRRQIAKNIKRINEKFKKYPNSMNVGVIVIQFATSLEEFYAYLFHPEKGLLFEADFSNLDCLVFFSMTNLMDIDMRDIYESGHIFTMLFEERNSIKPYIKAFMLDNIISVDKKVNPNFLEDAKKEYGVYRYVARHSVSFWVPEDASEENIENFALANSGIVSK